MAGRGHQGRRAPAGASPRPEAGRYRRPAAPRSGAALIKSSAQFGTQLRLLLPVVEEMSHRNQSLATAVVGGRQAAFGARP